MQNFFHLTESNVAFLQTLVALKRTGCDLWQLECQASNVKVTTFCTDTCFQSFMPLINCVVHHTVLKFSPCRYSIHAVMIIYWVEVRTVGWPHVRTDELGVFHGAEARLCHEQDVLAHCLAGRQTCLHQCCGSLVAASQ